MAREPFNRIWNEIPDAPDQFEEPTNATWEDGWRGGPDEDPPEAKWQNWWQNRADFALRQLERQGAMAWLADVPYEKWAKAYGTDGNRYTAVQPNTGQDPVSDDGSNWIADREPPSLGFSLTSNGWYSLPGGLIVQWFEYNPGNLSNNEVFSASFPIEFPNQCLQAFLSSTSGAIDAGVATEGMSVRSFSTASVTCISHWSAYPAQAGDEVLRFFAIGY